MKTQLLRMAAFTIIFVLALAGCSEEKKKPPVHPPVSGKITTFAEVVAFMPIPVHGYGLVAGLAGTGSSQCPPQIRNYLRQYIIAQLPKNSPMSADQLLDSPDNAVVKIEGSVPAASEKGDLFDLKITPVSGSQTTSLAYGRLYTANLMFATGSKRIATAQGSVLLDTIGTYQPTEGYILGGGSVLETYNIALALYKADYYTANALRNRITERFGDDAVTSAAVGVIQIQIPPKYSRQKPKFIALLKELYINENPQQEALRAEQLIKNLGSSEPNANAEIALEAIGKTQEKKLVAALDSADFLTKFRAAKCLLNLGSDRGLGILRQVAIDPTSSHRLEAIESIAVSAKRNDAVAILKQMLSDNNIQTRLAVYEHLRWLNDPAIATVRVAEDFEVDQVYAPGIKTIYAYRSDKPRIVIFGAPMIANPNIFVESADGAVIVNSPEKNTYVSAIRRFPQKNITLGPIKSSFDVVDIIKTLSELPANEAKKHAHLGLGLPYANTIAILNTMCAKGAINADFVAGPLPKFRTEPPPAPSKNVPANVIESSPKAR